MTGRDSDLFRPDIKNFQENRHRAGNSRRRTCVLLARPPRKEMSMLRSGLAWAPLLLCAWMQTATAAEFQVQMLNHGSDGQMQFAPQLLKIAPGDTVHFLAIDKGHNAQSID